MKVIKHLKHESPEYRLKMFFIQMPCVTKFLISITALCSIAMMIFGFSSSLNLFFMVDARPFLEMMLFSIIALTDYQREERKGSLFFIITFILKNFFLALLKISTNEVIFGNLQASIQVSSTSYPLLFCMTMAFRDMISKPNEQRYFLIDPFAIKNLFYPIFLAVLLELMGLRFDIIHAFLVSAVLLLIRFDKFVAWLCQKIDKKIIGERAIQMGILPTGVSQVQMSQIDRIVTSNSIVLEEQ